MSDKCGEGRTCHAACECRERLFAEAMELKRLLEELPEMYSLYHGYSLRNGDDKEPDHYVVLDHTKYRDGSPVAIGSTPLEALRAWEASK